MRVPRRRIVVAALASASLTPGVTRAGGGGRNVLVVVNENSEESLEIGNYYLHQRGIPAVNLCRIRTTTALTTDKPTYQAEIEAPVLACIAGSPYRARLDYLVLTRGVPILAVFPGGDVSTTALLQAMDTPLRGKDQEFADPYGFQNYPNPYRGSGEWFAHAKSFGGMSLYLATMLSGYWSEEARALVDQSIASDGNPPTAGGGSFFLEEGVPAADVRNADFPAAVSRLAALGQAATHVGLADPNVTGAVVAGHVNSGSYSAIGKTDIDSNTYPPGCIVDVLESYGLTPNNFTPGGADQTPVTWWIAAGATGGHGTVSEPYNVAFPDGFLLEPYVKGFNLAETFYQGIPYLYWMNLVLGDPLAAPYATPPAVTIETPAAGDTVAGNVTLGAAATTIRPEGILGLEFFVDDVLAGQVAAPRGQVAWDSRGVADGTHRLEVVALDASPVGTQATAGLDLVVSNLGRSVVITAPAAGSRVAGSFPATIELTGGGIDVAVSAEGLDVGGGTGSSPLTVTIDTALLGRGRHTFVAESSTGPAIVAVSRGVDLVVVKPPRLQALAPSTGPQTGATAVAIDGWNFEPDVRVLFGGRPAAVDRRDANHVIATTPTGPAGAVDVAIENPLGQTLALPGAFTYTASPCPATDPVSDLKLVKVPGPGLQLTWAPSLDPCRALYRVFSAADPPLPPLFPGDYLDRTVADQDGDPGGDESFREPLPGGSLVLYRVAVAGSDGGLGP